jgi:hypothetical protein
MLELENMRNGLPMPDILGDSENTNKNKVFAIAPMMGGTDCTAYATDFIHVIELANSACCTVVTLLMHRPT